MPTGTKRKSFRGNLAQCYSAVARRNRSSHRHRCLQPHEHVHELQGRAELIQAKELGMEGGGPALAREIFFLQRAADDVAVGDGPAPVWPADHFGLGKLSQLYSPAILAQLPSVSQSIGVSRDVTRDSKAKARRCSHMRVKTESEVPNQACELLAGDELSGAILKVLPILVLPSSFRKF